MISVLLDIDRILFYLINDLPHNLLLNSFFLFLTAAGYGGIVWFLLAIYLIRFEKKRNNKGLIALIIAGLINLILIEWWYKNLIGRLRPEFVLNHVIVVKDFSSSFSFPSGHAAFSFAASFILSKFHKKYTCLFYLLAVLVSFSRIYLGKHYPSDVLAGALVGIIIGYISLKISSFILHKKTHVR